MSTEQRIEAGVRAIVDGADVPPIRFSQIRARMTEPPAIQPGRRSIRYAFAAAAALAIVVVALPGIAPAFVQSIEARYRTALQALGGIAPPAAPASVISQLADGAKTVSLAQAQALVPFRIAPPAGVPNDAVLAGIVASPTEVYVKTTGTWHHAAPLITFWYRRASGQEFSIVADAYDPRERMGQYMFEARGETRTGHVILVKHRRFAWRNGEQVMTAIEGSELSAAEILAIQRAMHGTPVALRPLHAPDHSPMARLRMIVKP